jgi:hypothetical protein
MAFVIKEHRPGRWRVIVGIALGIWIASGWFAYELGWRQSNHDHDEAVSREKGLQGELTRLSDANSELQTQVSILQRSAQVDRQAKVELAKDVKNLQDLQAELREETSFYKSIISPDKGKAGLGIHSLLIVPVGDRMYHYKLILTQSGKSDSLTKGGVKVVLKGVLQGKEKNLDLGKINVADSPKLSYKFRYFQELSGSFLLPEDYSPREITVRLVPDSGKKSDKPVKTFDWQKVRLDKDDFNEW